MLDNIKKEFSTRTLVLIPIAIVFNIVIGELTVRLKLPIYLDSIGTVLVGAIAGPWAGALTGRVIQSDLGVVQSLRGSVFLCRGRDRHDGRSGWKKWSLPEYLTSLALHHYRRCFLFLVDGVHSGLYKFDDG